MDEITSISIRLISNLCLCPYDIKPPPPIHCLPTRPFINIQSQNVIVILSFLTGDITRIPPTVCKRVQRVFHLLVHLGFPFFFGGEGGFDGEDVLGAERGDDGEGEVALAFWWVISSVLRLIEDVQGFLGSFK